MGFKSLALAIIFQSVKDFRDPAYREESINFFMGEGFKIYSEIARLNCIKQSKTFLTSGGETWKLN
jgi:hypothetical protein